MSKSTKRVRFRVLKNVFVMLTLLLGCLAGVSNAQVVNPADKRPSTSPAQESEHVPSWKMPAIDVYGKAPLEEEDRIGTYAQPRWTAHRRFGETRVYVIPKGMTEFEYWSIPETAKDGTTEWKNQYEMEFGLPGRFQLDLYAVSHKVGNSESLKLDQEKVEVRWAFADWPPNVLLAGARP